jgi:hypothetical protein
MLRCLSCTPACRRGDRDDRRDVQVPASTAAVVVVAGRRDGEPLRELVLPFPFGADFGRDGADVAPQSAHDPQQYPDRGNRGDGCYSDSKSY